jgi:neutral trehalase
MDLNVFMVLNYRTLAFFFEHELENKEKAEKYTKLAVELQQSIDSVFLDPKTQVWLDYDLHAKKLRGSNFYPSNIFPLLLNGTSGEQCGRVLDYLKGLRVFEFKGNF